MKQVWVCERCKATVTMFVRVTQPPTCDCRARLKGKKEPINMKERNKK